MPCLREYNTFNLTLKTISGRRWKQRRFPVALNTCTIPSAQAWQKPPSSHEGTEREEPLCASRARAAPGRASSTEASTPAQRPDKEPAGHSSREALTSLTRSRRLPDKLLPQPSVQKLCLRLLPSPRAGRKRSPTRTAVRVQGHVRSCRTAEPGALLCHAAVLFPFPASPSEHQVPFSAGTAGARTAHPSLPSSASPTQVPPALRAFRCSPQGPACCSYERDT